MVAHLTADFCEPLYQLLIVMGDLHQSVVTVAVVCTSIWLGLQRVDACLDAKGAV